MPFNPNWSKIVLIPINRSQSPTAYPIAAAFPFRLRLNAKGAVNKTVINGKMINAGWLHEKRI